MVRDRRQAHWEHSGVGYTGISLSIFEDLVFLLDRHDLARLGLSRCSSYTSGCEKIETSNLECISTMHERSKGLHVHSRCHPKPKQLPAELLGFAAALSSWGTWCCWVPRNRCCRLVHCEEVGDLRQALVCSARRFRHLRFAYEDVVMPIAVDWIASKLKLSPSFKLCKRLRVQ
jgi:hypothetical protein